MDNFAKAPLFLIVFSIICGDAQRGFSKFHNSENLTVGSGSSYDNLNTGASFKFSIMGRKSEPLSILAKIKCSV